MKSTRRMMAALGAAVIGLFLAMSAQNACAEKPVVTKSAQDVKVEVNNANADEQAQKEAGEAESESEVEEAGMDAVQ